MNIREKVAKLSLITTVIHGVCTVFLVIGMVISVILCIVLTDVLNNMIGGMETIDPDSVTAGWEVLFRTGGGFVGFIGVIIVLVVAACLIGPICMNLFITIYGVRTYKKRDTAEFSGMIKNDSIIKVVLNGLGVLSTLGSVISSAATVEEELLYFGAVICVIECIPAIAITILSIIVLRNIRYIEEQTNATSQDYIENYEDNSPYFGQ